jgi:hypothetical protein
VSDVAAAVLDFYKSLPFNSASGVAEAIALINRTDLKKEYPTLVDLMNDASNFLEVGCGTVWLLPQNTT